ncbi:MAG TPA: RcnB family protein [Sphingomonadaceae bacterium]|nr:RcnB family protein [Sphingomonadaceae bacterium]
MSVLNVSLAVLAAMAGTPAAQTVGASAGDAHVARPHRGDILTVDNRLPGSAYVPPGAGWAYTAPVAGQRLAPAFYAAGYVVADPVGLPPATRDQLWVRYGPNVVLVDRRSGRVLRVAPNRW